jgi:N-acetylneuraminic acid mutarotase
LVGIFLAVLAWATQAATAQTNRWIWVAGGNTIGQKGVYGTLQIPANGNVPGARESASAWTDKDGNFWLFGGEGVDGLNLFGDLNDLWEFNPTTKQWTWMSGSSSVLCLGNGFCGQDGVYGSRGIANGANVPGGREGALSWVDGNGNLWLFGGDGFDSSANFGLLNDLWKFNPTTQAWTWVSGGSTLPKSGVVAGVLRDDRASSAREYTRRTPGWRLD